jgi:hypothetical protein
MFGYLLGLGPYYTSALVLGCLTIFFLARKALVDYKIRKVGGVRSAVLATNPLFGNEPLSRPLAGQVGQPGGQVADGKL